VKRFWTDMNPTVRGFLIIALIAAVIVVLSLEQTLASLYLLARIAFFLAIAFVVYLFWRERRSDIASWSRRAQLVFYGAGALIVADLAVFFWPGRTTAGLDAVAFLLVLGLAGFSMWRIWREEHSYGL
jgi:fucose 4-O-acetylase-like acetyltransferase